MAVLQRLVKNGTGLLHIAGLMCRPIQPMHNILRISARSYSQQLWPSMKYWSFRQSPSSTDTYRHIEQAQNAREIFNFISKKEHKEEIEKNCELVTHLCRRLVFTQYIEGEQNYPYNVWLKKDIHLAFNQLYPSLIKHFIAPVTENVLFTQVKLLVQKSVESLCADELDEVLLLLLYLGVDKYELLLRDIYTKARRELCETSWTGIYKLVHAAAIMAPADYTLYSEILKRVKNDLMDENVLENETLAFIRTIHACPLLFSRGLCKLLSEEMNRILANKEFMKDVEHVTLWTQAAARIYSCASVSVQIDLESNFLALPNVLENIRGEFSILQIGQMMRYLQKMYPQKAPRLFPMRNYVNEKSCKNLELKDLFIAAAYCEPGSLQNYVRDSLQEQLRRHVRSDLEGLVDYELVFKILSEGGMKGDLRRLLMYFVSVGMPFVAEDIELDRLVINNERNPEIRKMLLKNIDKLYQGKCGFRNQQFCALTAFVIANCGSELPNSLLRKMFRIIPNSDMNSMRIVINSLNVLYKVRRNEQIKNADHVNDLLLKAVRLRLESSDRNLTKGDCFALDAMFFSTMIESRNRDVAVGQLIMCEIGKLMCNQVTFKMKESIGMNIQMCDYYSPTIMEFLAHSVITHTSEVEQYQEEIFLSTLGVCANFGYKPQCMKELEEIALKVFNKAKEEKRWHVCVPLLNYLACLNILPTEELKCCFSQDSLIGIKKFVENNAYWSMKNDFIRLVCNLNRMVVLARPDLEIPWFGEGLTKKYNETDRTENSARIDEFIYESIVEMLGGSNFINRDVVNYDHKIPFELALDENHKPLPIANKDFEFSGNEQRIAIIPISRGGMAVNDVRVMLAQYFMKKRDLELLGYDVIYVLRNGWMQDEGVRKKNLYRALFESRNRRNLHVITGDWTVIV